MFASKSESWKYLPRSGLDKPHFLKFESQLQITLILCLMFSHKVETICQFYTSKLISLNL